MRLPPSAALLLASLAAACASTPGDAPPFRPSAPLPAPAPEDPAVAAARAADDAALTDAGDTLDPLAGHFLAVSGGKVIGGTLMREDTMHLLRAASPTPAHAYFFLLGTAGDRRENPPAVYGPRLAGTGLLAALGPPAGAEGEEVSLRITIEAASGLGNAAALELVIARGWSGTALVGAEDAAALGLHRSEIPGTVDVVELLTGRILRCRRALVRVGVPGDGESASRPPVLVEVLYPR